MKKVLSIFLICLLLFAAAGCSNTEPPAIPPRPETALYSTGGTVEIVGVEVDSSLGSDAVKYIKVTVNYINTSDSEWYVSMNNVTCYYDEEMVLPVIIDCDDYMNISPAILNPGITHSGCIWFKVPIDVEYIAVECIASANTAIFVYEI